MPLFTRAQKGLLRILEEAMKFDDYAHAVATIDTNHRHIHDGFYFHSSGRASVGVGANFDLLLTVPAGCYPHLQDFIFNIGDTPSDIKVYENTVTSADGTAENVKNRNRNSSNAPQAVLTRAPTVTAVGDELHDRFVGDTGGTGINQVGAYSHATGEEWLLAPGTKYLVRFTNNSGGTVTVSYETKWYEIGYVKQ